MYQELYSALRIAQIRYAELLREAEREREIRALRWQRQGRQEDRRPSSVLHRLFRSQARRRPVL